MHQSSQWWWDIASFFNPLSATYACQRQYITLSLDSMKLILQFRTQKITAAFAMSLYVNAQYTLSKLNYEHYNLFFIAFYIHQMRRAICDISLIQHRTRPIWCMGRLFCGEYIFCQQVRVTLARPSSCPILPIYICPILEMVSHTRWDIHPCIADVNQT